MLLYFYFEKYKSSKDIVVKSMFLNYKLLQIYELTILYRDFDIYKIRVMCVFSIGGGFSLIQKTMLNLFF